MSVGLDEFVTFLRGCLTRDAVLRVDCEFRGFTAAFEGRLLRVDLDRVAFIADDSLKELAFDPRVAARFGYAPAVRLPEERSDFRGGMVAFLSNNEWIAFSHATPID